VRGSTAGGYASRTSTDTSPREPIDAASMLEELPSVHVRRLGAEGSFASISVRGSAPSQVGVVLGAIPLTSGADPAFDVGSLPLWPGAGFRVYRGFAPAALGTTGYLGGVLAIDPPSPAAGGRTEWSALAGSLGSLKLRIGDLRRVGGVESGTGFFASRSDGDFSYPVQYPLGTGRIAEHTRANAGQVVVGGIARVAVERPWGSVAALILADARRLGVPGTTWPHQTSFAHLATTRAVVGLEASVRTGGAGAVRLLGWGRRETSALDDPRGELDPTHATTTRSAIEAAGLGVGWRGRPIDALTLGLVLDGRGERFVPESAIGFATSAPASRLAAGLGADLEWRPTPALTLSGSGRLDARRDDAGGARSIGGEALGVSYGGAPTGHLGGSYRFSDAAIVSAHGGALARPPGFQELYGNGASLVANPSLRPERAIEADAGLHGDAAAGGVTLGYELVGFVTSATDLITFVPRGLATFQATNIDRAILGGAEITVSLGARGLRTQATYTFLRTVNLGDGLQHGQPLPNRPAHDLAYDASYRFGPVRLRYGLDLIAGTTLGSDRPFPLPPRVLHGMGASLDVPGVTGLRAGVSVQNLFDQRLGFVWSDTLQRAVAIPVSDFLGFPLPGRTVWATVRFTRPAPP
jgi:hypothetical protein